VRKFDGYRFDAGKSSSIEVRDPGEGGYVYAEPGIYELKWLFWMWRVHASYQRSDSPKSIW
jgi:hypothetical protein